MVNSFPTVSIITVALNAAATIRKTLESIVSQTYPAIEHIVVDGGSTDGTSEILEEYRGTLARVIVEKDRGISDAFNKGLGVASGEFVQFLNADDWLEPRSVENAIGCLLQTPEVGFVFGDIVKVNAESGAIVRVKGDVNYIRSIDFVMPRLNHPTVVARRQLFISFGGFDERWKIAMDYDWLMRVHRGGVKGVYVPGVTVFMTIGGRSDVFALQAFREVRDISIAHGQEKVFAYAYFAVRCVKHATFKLLRLR